MNGETESLHRAAVDVLEAAFPETVWRNSGALVQSNLLRIDVWWHEPSRHWMASRMQRYRATKGNYAATDPEQVYVAEGPVEAVRLLLVAEVMDA